MFDVETLNAFYEDLSARDGMSGVYVYQTNHHTLQERRQQLSIVSTC